MRRAFFLYCRCRLRCSASLSSSSSHSFPPRLPVFRTFPTHPVLLWHLSTLKCPSIVILLSRFCYYLKVNSILCVLCVFFSLFVQLAISSLFLEKENPFCPSMSLINSSPLFHLFTFVPLFFICSPLQQFLNPWLPSFPCTLVLFFQPRAKATWWIHFAAITEFIIYTPVTVSLDCCAQGNGREGAWSWLWCGAQTSRQGTFSGTRKFLQELRDSLHLCRK